MGVRFYDTVRALETFIAPTVGVVLYVHGISVKCASSGKFVKFQVWVNDFSL